MALKKEQEIKILQCPTCRGSGFLNAKTCSQCKGIPQAALVNGQIVYWGKIIDKQHNAFYKLEDQVKNLTNIFLLIFGCVGVILLFWEFFVISKTTGRIWSFYNSGNWRMFIFWISVLTDSYLYYRYVREIESYEYIDPGSYIPLPEETVLTWQNFEQASKDQKIDISKVFSADSSHIVMKAYELAQQYGHHKVGPVHLLIALTDNADIMSMFIRMGVNFQALKNSIARILETYRVPTGKPLYFSADLYKSLFSAYKKAYVQNSGRVRPPQILISIVEVSETLNEIFYDLDIDVVKISNVSKWIRFEKGLHSQYLDFRSKASLRPKSSMNRAMTSVATPFLDQFSVDLTARARDGHLEECIGREKEIDEIFRIIRGGSRTSIIMVGPPGIGKKTIVNGIAQRMVAENVPKLLSDKRLISIDVARLAGGSNPAESGERMNYILGEIYRAGNIALFIDNVSQLVGITQGSGGGSIDLAEILAQSLSKKNIIAFTTSLPGEYARFIEGKSGLDQVLEKVSVEEVEGNDAIQIIEAKSNRIEAEYKVFFTYDALEKVIELSSRYLHERYLPEKAIEIMEEAAAVVSQIRGKDTNVTGKDIAKIISEKTEIPLTDISETESDKLLHLEDEIHQRIVGQDEAVRMVSTAIRRARADLRDKNRPIVNLLFLGPTGVGKTELAKTVIKVYFGSDKEMIRLDMSEYQNKSSINRLIGAPPGLSGSETGGYLTEQVRKNPYSLVLLDEIEKAHPDILNVFLQVMDDGRLTDSTGRTIDFTNVVLITTSNAGTPVIQKMNSEGKSAEEIKNYLLENELMHYFRPEFLNRYDGIIIFKPLTMNQVKQIASIMLSEVKANLEEKGIDLDITVGAIEELAEAGFDPKFGARPLRRIIQERVNDTIAEQILTGKVGRRDKIILDIAGKVEIIKARKV